MRINVYAEELTDEVELVSTTINDDEFGVRTFYGVRMFLKSHPDLHHSAEDDDRTAITFWTKQEDAELLFKLLRHMTYKTDDIITTVSDG